MRNAAVMVAVVALALLGAGCIGDFQVRQTEPFRISIEEPQEVRGEEGDEHEFVIEDEDDDDREIHRVVVEVRAVSQEPAQVIVILRDRDTGEELERDTVDVEGDGSQTVNIDVRGRNNVVVVTQVVEGTADVQVNAAAEEAPPEEEPPAENESVTEAPPVEETALPDAEGETGAETEANATV